MYCSKCGKKINDNDLFCPFCGSEVVDEINPDNKVSEHRSVAKKKGHKTRNIILISVAAVLIIVAIIVFVIINNRNSDIDLSEYVPGDFVSGFEGYGYIDNDKDYVANPDKVKEYIDNMKNEKQKGDMQKLFDSIVYTSKADSKRLANGDTIEINAEYDKTLAEDIGVEVLNETITYKIENLEEGEDIAYQLADFTNCQSDFVLYDSDSRTYDQATLKAKLGYDTDKVQNAINEIYARHGYIFDSIKTYDNCSWYIPVYPKSEFKQSWLNTHESANLKALITYRNFLKSDATKCIVCGKKIYKSFNAKKYEDDKYYCTGCDISKYEDKEKEKDKDKD